MILIEEPEFREKLYALLREPKFEKFGSVMGPGRSGAIAAVYASHFLRIPFIPYGEDAPDLGPLLIIDTATDSGRTLRRAQRKYEYADAEAFAAYHEPPRVYFWYERPKPQHYKHDKPTQGQFTTK